MATVLFVPESAYGPTNNCIGIADVLRQRGHRVVFAAEASWQGKLTALGFAEDLIHLAPPPQDGAEQDAGQFWKDFIRDTAPEFRKPTIEQLETWIKPVWVELINGVKYSHPQLTEIVARVRPDVIVEDNVVDFPALHSAGTPFVRIVSCNPLEVKGAGVAPPFSGYPADDQSGWAAFRAAYDASHRELWSEFNAWVLAQGAPALPELEFIGEGDLNLYVYPEIADYTDARPLGPSWHRLDSSVRETEGAFELPAALAAGDAALAAGDPAAGPAAATGARDTDSALVYFSLGSLGSADVELMRGIIAALADTPHRYIVSKGPLHTEIELAPNMWGAEFLPQTKILPLVDLVITHGGNNTTTEALHFGKPMVLFPLFWDQHDNAQRMAELGYGVRLDPYRFTPEQLHAAIDQLLGDRDLRERLAKEGAEIRRRDGLRRAADLIEGLL